MLISKESIFLNENLTTLILKLGSIFFSSSSFSLNLFSISYVNFSGTK